MNTFSVIAKDGISCLHIIASATRELVLQLHQNRTTCGQFLQILSDLIYLQADSIYPRLLSAIRYQSIISRSLRPEQKRNEQFTKTAYSIRERLTKKQSRITTPRALASSVKNAYYEKARAMWKHLRVGFSRSWFPMS